MPHQVRFLRWARARRSAGAYLQMRLGKSLCAVRWGRTRPGVRKALITCPLSVVPSWRRELAAEGVEACELVGTPSQKERALVEAGRDHVWYLANHDALMDRSGGRTRPSAIAMAPWDLAIIDESTLIRNPRAKVTRCALDHLADAKYKMLLSGLPNPEGPEDLVTQTLFLRGELMGATNYWEWRAEHMQAGAFGWSIKRKSLGLLHAAVGECSYFLTRAQAGLPDLKERATRWVRLPRAVMAALRAAKKELQVGDRLTNSALAALTWQCQLAGGRWPHDVALHHGAKLDELEYLLRGELRGQRVVVWARYTPELYAAVGRARECGRWSELVNGDFSPEERDARIQRWRGTGAGVLVAQPQCLKMGVDLSDARVAVVLSNYFDYEIRAQLEDRLVHPRKAEPALIIDVVAEGTVDEDVAEALTDKACDAKSFAARLAGLVRRRAEGRE